MTPDEKLLQQALDALEAHADIGIRSDKAIEAIRARLAQPEQEPVAHVVVIGDMVSVSTGSAGLKSLHNLGDGAPIYLHPPKREWQGLTDEEVMSLLPGAVRLPPGWADTVRAIEAALKAKNG